MPRDPAGGGVELLTANVSSAAEDVRDALRQVGSALGPANLSDEERFSVELVLAETLNNIVEHAFDDPGLGRIELSIRTEPGGLFCRITDNGREMPGGALPKGQAAPVPDEIDDLPEGGFGWFLIRELARDLTYERHDAMNHLSFHIKVGPAPAGPATASDKGRIKGRQLAGTPQISPFPS